MEDPVNLNQKTHFDSVFLEKNSNKKSKLIIKSNDQQIKIFSMPPLMTISNLTNRESKPRLIGCDIFNPPDLPKIADQLKSSLDDKRSLMKRSRFEFENNILKEREEEEKECQKRIKKLSQPSRTRSRRIIFPPTYSLCFGDSTEPSLSEDGIEEAMVEKELSYFLQLKTSNLEHHIRLRPAMRSILIDWMMEVSQQFGLSRQTFHLSREYIDRYLSKSTGVRKTKLQLIGITSLFIASKFEERVDDCPPLSDFSEATGGICSPTEISQMEINILTVLDISLNPPTIYSWILLFVRKAAIMIRLKLRRKVNKSEVKKGLRSFLSELENINRYIQLLELVDSSVLDIKCLAFHPRKIALSACYLVFGAHPGFNFELFFEKFGTNQIVSSSILREQNQSTNNNIENLEPDNIKYPSVKEITQCCFWLKQFSLVPFHGIHRLTEPYFEPNTPLQSMYTRQMFNPNALDFIFKNIHKVETVLKY